MRLSSRQWIKLFLSAMSFILTWYFLFLVFDDYGSYFGWFLAGVIAYLTYHLLSVLFDFL